MRRFAIAIIAAAGLSLPLATPAHAAEKAHVTASALKCRATPEASGQIVAKLRRGEHVRIVGRSAPWAKVKPTSNRPCWASSKFLAPDADAYRTP